MSLDSFTSASIKKLSNPLKQGSSKAAIGLTVPKQATHAFKQFKALENLGFETHFDENHHWPEY